MPVPAFTLAQLSDPHLGPLPALGMRHWNVKRGLGWLNWTRRRQAAHLPATLERIVADVRALAPDHIAVTGDLANIGLPAEFEAAERWLAALGPPERVSVVPGNHDVYCRLGRAEPGVARWAAWMTGDGDELPPGRRMTGHGDLGDFFPYVRRLGRVALIGLNSAVETAPLLATGRIGPQQLARLGVVLDRLAGERRVRIVLVHHPVLPGQAEPTHALRDAAALEAVIVRHGADLVLHGHKHRRMLEQRDTRTGRVVLVGVPSASVGAPYGRDHLAGYLVVRVHAGAGGAIELEHRGLAAPGGPVVEIERIALATEQA